METYYIPRDPHQRWEWLKYQLRSKDSSFSDIAKELGITRQSVRRARVVPYPKVQKAIASKLGIDPQIIWPERY